MRVPRVHQTPIQMKRTISLIGLSLGIFIVSVFANEPTQKAEGIQMDTKQQKVEELKTPFDKVMAVLTHQRCINCHPSDNVPKQGEDSHPHHFGMLRGKDDHGFVAMKCNTCHQDENNKYAGVPGAPHWALAPASMAWEGMSRIEVAQALLDEEHNGGRSHEELIHHLTEDPLVLWAWEPGVNNEGEEREKPPIAKDEFIKAVKEWFETGAVIPEK